ncbi:MAG: undecaprenyldiphospho-muramoylpentapeptide beta-N-acetylglucosaminyltransferase [Caldisericia bacterium]|nr:undecaprenyldiphospho-muramoylpentapeptide beta-N-acetylglucosaminyltransferase [Caldisericia bacterium]MDD4614608.1 undecaprenyldiphospho-muramoylpentapeptide beta-N-acetylglucosaminyltransferase [Caldisericia bacterium]
MKLIVFTGGGTAGHVFPNIALINELYQNNWFIHYIGTSNGPEHRIIEKWNIEHQYNIVFHSIKSGKYRRNLSFKNVQDLFRIRKGFKESLALLSNIQPMLLFSKGGFVSVPPSYAAHRLGIPVLTHESDFTVGLANKLINRVATKIYTSFPTNLKNAMYTGNPIRKELMNGNKKKGLKYCNFTDKKPVLFIMGGSQGSSFINDLVKRSIPYLLCQYQIIHITGRDQFCHVDDSCYKGIQFAQEELPDLYACADLIIGRAGANSIFEGLYLRKPMILIPLPKKYSRGEQIKNARYFEEKGLLRMLQQDKITTEILVKTIQESLESKEATQQKINAFVLPDANTILIDEIESFAKKSVLG